jgi:formate hydrogenlyase subunit 3/multisubunit Na+/H+ antiporter MnhD subunit
MNMDAYGYLLLGMAVLLASSIVSPLLAGKRKLAGWSNFIFCSAAGVLFLTVSMNILFGGASHESKFFEVGPYKLYFLIDGFSAFFITLIAFMSMLTAFYTIEYMEHYPDYSLRGFYFSYPVFVLGMIGIVTVDDLSIGFTIAWQLMTLASYFLVKFDKKEKGIVWSANKYLILMELAWALIIAGMMLIPGNVMGDSLHTLTKKLGSASGFYVYAIYGLILVGFAFKAGVFPLGQLWLPDAHSVAPSPISALLSGVMIKTGVYGIIRTMFWMVPDVKGFDFNGQFWGALIASFGVVTLFIGTVQALKQHDAKRLHAYHSIGQMGYIILGIGSALFMFYSANPYVKLLSVVAIVGALYHTLNHTVFKGLLFLTTGSVQYATGTKDMNKLGGLIKIMPITTVIALIASFSIAGVPAFSGFMSKWSIISANILGGSEVGFMVLFGIIALMTSAITLASYIKFFGMTFTSIGHEWNAKASEVKEVPAQMLIPKFILAALCIIQGVLPFFYFETIIGIFKASKDSIVHTFFNSVALNNMVFDNAMGVQVQLPGSSVLVSAIAVPAVLVAIFAVIFIIVSLFRKSGGSVDRKAEVWLCGYQDLNDKTRYRSTSMYSSFKNFLKWTGGNTHD